MALFITSKSQAKQAGVYAFERRPPITIDASGDGVVGFVEQLPWGPEQTPTAVYEFSSFLEMFAPFGMSHTGAGYLAIMGKSFPAMKVVRVLGPTAATATATINKAGPAALIVVTAKYKGVAGNSIVCTTAAASDGDANHFNLTVSVTGPSGTTSDTFENLNYSGVGADSAPSFSSTLLVGNITKSSSGVPIIGSTTMTGGLDGTITSAEYVGTQGAADKGAASLEGDTSVDVVMTADPGNSLRAAVNAGLVAHADYTTDRIATINGNSGLTLAQVQTDVANYRSIRAVYCDVWAYVRDDVDGTERITPPAPFFASLAVSLSPSTSPAWKGEGAKKYLAKITRLETLRGAAAGANTLQGICTLQPEKKGGWSFESAVNTYRPIDPSRGTYKRTRMGHYLAKAITSALRENVDAPNVPSVQQDELTVISEFLDGLVKNRDTDPFNLPHLAAAGIDDPNSFNSPATLAAGEFWIPFSAQVSSDQSKIFLSINYGESVTVSSAL